MLKIVKRRLLHLIHSAISRFWVQPLEDRVIPRLEKKTGWIPSLLLKLANWGANAGRVVVLEMRIQVIHWAGLDWSVSYIGNGKSVAEICHLLFPEAPQTTEISRAFLWQATALARKFASEGDLVVCELNQILKIIPAGPGLSFVVPDWIKQVLEGIDRPLNDILADMNQTMRRNIRRIESQNYSYVYTQAQEDFNLFYHRMYAPYIQWRYGDRREMMSYEEMQSYYITNSDFRRWGGLILVKQSEEPVCGMMCYLKDGKCVALDMGVLDGRFELVKQGSNVALWWFMLDWARRQGSKQFDLGNSRAQTSNGSFKFKRQWGAHVVMAKGRISRWSFYSKEMPGRLREHLNAVGWISETAGRHYRLYLLDPEESNQTLELQDLLDEAANCGLDGVVTISTQGEMQIVSQGVSFARSACNIPSLPSL